MSRGGQGRVELCPSRRPHDHRDACPHRSGGGDTRRTRWLRWSIGVHTRRQSCPFSRGAQRSAWSRLSVKTVRSWRCSSGAAADPDAGAAGRTPPHATASGTRRTAARKHDPAVISSPSRGRHAGRTTPFAVAGAPPTIAPGPPSRQHGSSSSTDRPHPVGKRATIFGQAGSMAVDNPPRLRQGGERHAIPHEGRPVASARLPPTPDRAHAPLVRRRHLLLSLCEHPCWRPAPSASRGGRHDSRRPHR